jgi:hypothetical protein
MKVEIVTVGNALRLEYKPILLYINFLDISLNGINIKNIFTCILCLSIYISYFLRLFIRSHFLLRYLLTIISKLTSNISNKNRLSKKSDQIKTDNNWIQIRINSKYALL